MVQIRGLGIRRLIAKISSQPLNKKDRARYKLGEGSSSISLVTKDSRSFKFQYSPEHRLEVCIGSQMKKLAFPGSPTETFAFQHNLHVDGAVDGWNMFDPLREYKRLGLTAQGSGFRISTRSLIYEMIPRTHPSSSARATSATLSFSLLVSTVPRAACRP